MLYKFNEFEFDSDSLLLTNNGKTQAIRHNEAKLLALLLEQADTVLNKEDILSHVWQKKIVSEQVVFQNISHLRNLFGIAAIKTFPKLGYQWQLKTEISSHETNYTSDNQQSHNKLDSLQQSSRPPPAKKRFTWLFVALTCFIFIMVSVINFQNDIEQEKTDSVIKLAYIPITNLDDTTNAKHDDLSFEDNSDFDFTVLPHIDTELFIETMEIEYPKLSKKHPFILTGTIRSYKQQVYLDFMLKGPVLYWQGQLSGSSIKDVVAQMQQHLKQQVIYDLISKPQPPELKQARLSIAHQISPNDLIILRKLSIFYFKIDELEKAMLMADKLFNLAKHHNNSQHMGRALLYQSQILRKMKLYDLSANKLKLAIEQFEKINDLEHQWHAWYNQSWLDHQQKNYLAVKESLLKSAELAYRVPNKLGEIEALSTLAALANEYQNDADKYLYLQQVENKMTASQLPSYHFAEISYRYATFASALSEKEPHLKKVLKLTALTPDHWTAKSSRKQLMLYYITKNRLVEAQNLIENLTSDNDDNSYLITLLAQAKKQTKKMIRHAQRTFEQAQLAGNRQLSLDVALLLCKQEVNCDLYSQYINDNATAYWRRTNEIQRLSLKR